MGNNSMQPYPQQGTPRQPLDYLTPVNQQPSNVPYGPPSSDRYLGITPEQVMQFLGTMSPQLQEYLIASSQHKYQSGEMTPERYWADRMGIIPRPQYRVDAPSYGGVVRG